MTLPQYAQNVPDNRIVEILCRGKCGCGRYAKIIENENNSNGTKITSDSFAECLKCGFKASDPSNWEKII